ncbi:hypothetical protein C8Q75DRAFT_804460 [Abortiporus biennis]|nr:hypothetical protein C8Q75DRAFT_804460 [Abortiporus biennis]
MQSPTRVSLFFLFALLFFALFAEASPISDEEKRSLQKKNLKQYQMKRSATPVARDDNNFFPPPPPHKPKPKPSKRPFPY